MAAEWECETKRHGDSMRSGCNRPAEAGYHGIRKTFHPLIGVMSGSCMVKWVKWVKWAEWVASLHRGKGGWRIAARESGRVSLEFRASRLLMRRSVADELTVSRGKAEG